MKRQRKGCIYEELTRVRYRRGVGYYLKRRYRGEMTVYGKRFRCTSTSYRSVEMWRRDMVEKYGDY